MPGMRIHEHQIGLPLWCITMASSPLAAMRVVKLPPRNSSSSRSRLRHVVHDEHFQKEFILGEPHRADSRRDETR